MGISKTRSKWVDIAKGITIAALVLIHIDYTFPDSKLFPISVLLGGVWRTPVFFIIGGFFIKEEKLISPIAFIKRTSENISRCETIPKIRNEIQLCRSMP